MRLILNLVLAVTVLVFVLSVEQHTAVRVFDGKREERINKTRIISRELQSALSGPVPSSGPSSCSRIPDSGAPPCPDVKKLAGHAMAKANAPSKEALNSPSPPSK